MWFLFFLTEKEDLHLTISYCSLYFRSSFLCFKHIKSIYFSSPFKKKKLYSQGMRLLLLEESVLLEKSKVKE